jgi:hypothetical protein
MIRTASLFSQVLQLFPRLEFERAVHKHQAERYAKGLSCRQQFVAMLFCQLAQAHSLREICGGLDWGPGPTTLVPRGLSSSIACSIREGYLPTFALVTAAKVSDVAVARLLTFAKGSIVVFDRGYKDYDMWARWTTEGVFFVSRLVRGTPLSGHREPPIAAAPQHSQPMRSSAFPANMPRSRAAPAPIAIGVVVWLPDKQQELVLITKSP